MIFHVIVKVYVEIMAESIYFLSLLISLERPCAHCSILETITCSVCLGREFIFMF